jgi:hypothetical protein
MLMGFRWSLVNPVNNLLLTGGLVGYQVSTYSALWISRGKGRLCGWIGLGVWIALGWECVGDGILWVKGLVHCNFNLESGQRFQCAKCCGKHFNF